MIRKLARSAGILSIIAGVAALAAALAWPALMPLAANRAARFFEERTGAQLSLSNLEARLDGQARVGTLTAERDGFRVQCDGLTVDLNWLAVARGAARIESVVIERCAVRPGQTAAEPVERRARDTSTARDIPSAAAATALFDEVSEYVSHAEIHEVVASTDRAEATATDVRWDVRHHDASLRGTVSVRAEGLPAIATSFSVERVGDGLRVASATPQTIAGARVTFETLDWEGSEIVVHGITADTVQGDRARLDTLIVSGAFTCPRIRVVGAEVSPADSRLPSWLAEEPGETNEAGDGSSPPSGDELADVPARDDASGDDPNVLRPSRAAQALDALARHLAQVDGLLGSVPSVPCAYVHLRQVALTTGARRAVVESAELSPDGQLAARINTPVAAGSFAVNLRTREAIDLTLDRLDVNLLLGTAGRSATEGEVAVNGRLQRVAGLRLEFVGEVELRESGFEHPGVAAAPLRGIDAAFHAAAQLRYDARPELSATLSADFEGVPLSATLAVVPTADSFDVAFEGGVAAPTPCNRIWRAIPEGMIPNIGREGILFDGAAAPRLTVAYELGRPYSFELRANEFLTGCLVERVDRDFDPRGFLDADRVFRVTQGVTEGVTVEVGPGTPGWTPIDTLPGWVPAAMYLSEEIGFWHNPGVSVGLINRAVRLNLDRSRYAYGGSTVTQQLVKNLFLTRTKTLSRKLEEAVIVMAMEQWVPKVRILELYLNCIEFGPNIYGIAAASEYYFGRPPQQLTPLEAVFLANLKPSPLSGARHLARGHSPATGWWIERTQEMLQRLVDYGGFIGPDEVTLYAPYVVALTASPLAQSVPYKRIERPVDAYPPATMGIEAVLAAAAATSAAVPSAPARLPSDAATSPPQHPNTPDARVAPDPPAPDTRAAPVAR